MKLFLLTFFSVFIFNINFGQTKKELKDSSYYNPIEKKTYKAVNGFKTYNKGEEVNSISKGLKETKLEKVVFLSSDEILNNNTSIEEIKTIIDKTNNIFIELFKDSKKPGKIMVQFELEMDKNIIQFAVRDNLDLDIMKNFEIKVNEETYPNSKKESVKFQLIYKVNSYNETE